MSTAPAITIPSRPDRGRRPVAEQNHSDLAGPSHGRTPFVMLGGVPGAGKTTAVNLLVGHFEQVRTVDSERLRRRVEATLPAVPYRWYRWAVHALSVIHLLFVVLCRVFGDDRPVVVAAPATRPMRRTLVGWWARACGWDPVLLMIDVSRATALRGQHQRGRVLRPAAFAAHWRRWQHHLSALRAADAAGTALGPWTTVRIVGRDTVVRYLLRIVARPAPRPVDERRLAVDMAPCPIPTTRQADRVPRR